MISQLLDNLITEAFVALDRAYLQAASESHRLVGSAATDTNMAVKRLNRALDELEQINSKVIGKQNGQTP